MYFMKRFVYFLYSYIKFFQGWLILSYGKLKFLVLANYSFALGLILCTKRAQMGNIDNGYQWKIQQLIDLDIEWRSFVESSCEKVIAERFTIADSMDHCPLSSLYDRRQDAHNNRWYWPGVVIGVP